MTTPYHPVSVSQTLKNVGGYTMTTNMSGKTAANASTYSMRNVAVTNSSVVNQLKYLTKFPFTPIAVALVVAGYIYDELNDEYTMPTTFDEYTGLGSCSTGPAAGNNKTVSECLDSFNQYCINNPSIWYCPLSTHHTVIDGRLTKVELKGSDASPKVHWIPNDYIQYANDIYSNDPNAVTNVDDDEYIEIFDNFTPYQQNDIWNDPLTNRFSEPSPMDDVAQDLTNDHNNANDGNELTEPSVDIENGDTGLMSEADTPTKQSEVSNSENQCDLFPNSLSCQEFGDELTPDDIITQTPDFDYSPVNISSDNSCPVPSNITLSSGHNIEFSYQPICEFGGLLSYLIIAISTFTGAFILVGGVKD